jgi:(R,R)-butanediol dehydrogenase/meso-butanediol dehydrogenase/diacetyl reductase
MKAARYYKRGDIRIEQIPIPKVQPGTVGIDVAFCGICGTDLHEYMDGPIFIPSACPHPISGECAPLTLGHEMSGTIYEVGDGITDLKVGDKVVVEPYIIDDKVDTSANNNAYHLSPNMSFIGLGGGGGGLSEKIVVKRRWVHPVGPDMQLDQAALIEPLSVGYHAFKRSGGKAGEFALITGAGPIGLLTAAVLRAEGITVAISEPSALRRQKALDSGVATHVFDPKTDDVVAKVRKLTGGAGADLAFECTSVQPAFDTLVDGLKATGVLVVVSIWAHPASLNMGKLVLKEIDIRGTIAYVNSHPQTIKLVQEGKIDLKPFITGVIGLDNLVSDGFDTLIHRNETAVKILVDPRK